ncbi:MAG: hypothetical protein KAU84_04400 [Thermoplasmatales archaeon]|nr:hypothetical protein [Thermoplasmatales archaeon]
MYFNLLATNPADALVYGLSPKSPNLLQYFLKEKKITAKILNGSLD